MGTILPTLPLRIDPMSHDLASCARVGPIPGTRDDRHPYYDLVLLWEESGSLPDRSPESWLKMAAPMIDGFRGYVANARDAFPEIPVCEPHEILVRGYPDEGSISVIKPIADLYAGFLAASGGWS